MHELSIAQGILAAIERTLGEKKTLTRVNLTIGPLAGIAPESLEFWFTEIAKEAGFGAPELTINRTDAAAVCAGCGLSYEVHSFYSGCPGCGGFERTITRGHECTVDSVEVEDTANV